MSTAGETSAPVTVHVKGPSGLKLSLEIDLEITVLQMKERIEQENKDFPADSQRLIYSGKVLKDAETLKSYNLKDGPTRPHAGASTGAAESQGVPASFSAGQQFANNPLSALNRADYAGPHMASILNEAGGMFGNFGGMNPRDPNVMLGMLQNPEFLQQMRDMLSRPEVVDQIIASNPQMQAMGPQMREMMSSEYFRNMITDPEAIQRMARLSQMLGGAGFGDPATGLGSAPGAAWPPPGAFGTPEAPRSTPQNAGATGAAPTPGANPLESLAQLQQLLGGGAGTPSLSALAGLGGFPPAAAPPADARPPEERYATQLEQLQSMGFYDARANLSALLMSGGSVEGAVGILLGQP